MSGKNQYRRQQNFFVYLTDQSLNRVFVAAVINNDKYKVNQLLAIGVDVNQIVPCTVNCRRQPIRYTTTVLTLAVRLALGQMVKLLLKHGADPNLDCEMTPLGVAAQTNNVRLVMMLLEAKANMNILTHPVKYDSAAERSTSASNLKQTPLHIACRKGYKDVVKCLALHRALNSIVDYNNETPSQVAKRLGRRDLFDIIKLTASDGPCMDLVTHLYSNDSLDEWIFQLQRNWTKKGRNYLHIACVTRPDGLPCLTWSLDSFASVEDRDVLGYTPLHYACMFGLLNFAELLVKRGADVNATDSDGETPINISLKYNHMGVAFLLIENKCTILPKHLSMRNSNGNTLLHIACRQQRAAAARHLLQSGAGLLARNANSLSPMYLAGRTGNIDLLMELVDFVRAFKTDDDTFYLSVIDELVSALSIATGIRDSSKLLQSSVVGRSCSSESVCRRCRKFTPEVAFHLVKIYIVHSNVGVESCFQRMKDIGRNTLKQLVANCCCNCTSTILHAACRNAGFSCQTYLDKPECNHRHSIWHPYGTKKYGLTLAKFMMMRHTALDAVDDGGNTAMHIACLHGDLDAIKLMDYSTAIAGLSIMHERNNESRTPLWYAFVNNHVECVKYILQMPEVKPDDSVLHAINDVGNTLLSVIGLEYKRFFSLLDMGARINTSRNERLNRPIVDFVSDVLKDGCYDKALKLIRNGCECYETKRLRFPGRWNELAGGAISTQHSIQRRDWFVLGLQFHFQPNSNDFRMLMTWWKWLYEAGYPPDSQTVATLYAIDNPSVMAANDREWLTEAVGAPQSLFLQCVRAIRRQLVLAEPHGATILPLVDQLPLANLLKTHLKLSDEPDVQFPEPVNPFRGFEFQYVFSPYETLIDSSFEEQLNDIFAYSDERCSSSACKRASRLDIQTAKCQNQKKKMLKSIQKQLLKSCTQRHNSIQSN